MGRVAGQAIALTCIGQSKISLFDRFIPAAKQAYFKDVNAGTFAEIVQAAERCTAKIIHPGTPLNPRERDLDKWIERAKPFN